MPRQISNRRISLKRSGTRSRWTRAVLGSTVAPVLVVLLLGIAVPSLASAAGTGQITGTVTDAVTHSPIEDIEVCAYQASDFEYAGCDLTDSGGHYDLIELGTRSYKLEFSSWYESNLDYVTQFYNDKETAEEADPVSVTDGSTTSGINAAMHEGGRITGTVTDDVTHAPIEGIEACAHEVSGDENFYGCGETNASGTYTIVGVPTGSVVVDFRPAECSGAGCTTADYIHQYYNGKSNYEEADHISVTAGSTTSGIDAAMHQGGRITGSVTNATTHAAIENIRVCAYSQEYEGSCGTTDAGGHYTINGLKGGTYTVEFFPAFGVNYLNQYYNGKTESEEADTVTVTSGATTSGIDAAMQEGGKVTGTVTDAATHEPIGGVEVCPNQTAPPYHYYECGYTDPSGDYTIAPLYTGTLKIHFYSPYESDYADQYYNNKPTEAQADVVSVTQGSTVSHVNAQLHHGGRIVGKVTDATTHNGVADIFACARLASVENVSECDRTASDGTYEIKGLIAGSYKVSFEGPYEETDYLAQYYNGKSSPSQANLVPVTEGATVSNINAALQEGGKITGTVTASATHSPIEGAEVCLSRAANEFEYVDCEETDGAGHYTLRALQTGSYKVEFYPGYICGGPSSCSSQNYVRQFYDGKGSWAQADAVSVTVGTTTSGIDAEMHEGGLITGSVTDAVTHEPVEYLEVCAFEHGAGRGGLVRCGYTNSSGTYSINGLATASYDVVFRVNSEFYSPLNYAPQYYNGSSSRASANPVSVTEGSTTSGIDAEMHEGGKITGTVTDAVTHEPVEGVEECVSKVGDAQEEEEYFLCGYSNSSGQYEIKALGTGSYKVQFRESYYQPSEVKYARQYYNNKITYGAAEVVSVTAGTTSADINAAMQEGGRITGTITDASTSDPLEDAEACVTKPGEEEEYFACGYSNASGDYMIPGIPPGTYDVVFHGPYGTSYAAQYYDGKASIGEGTSLPVTTGSTTPNIDAALTGATPPSEKPTNTAAPVLSGTPSVGSTLSCSTGSWEHSPSSYEYVWLRGSTAISGAAASEYQVQAADQGFSITCEVTAINAAGQDTATSNSLTVPAAAGAPVNTIAPALSGTPAVGSTLSCSTGSWEHSPTGYSFAWRRDGSLISGQTGSGYTIQSGDAGHGISCEVTAENGVGSSSASSNTLDVPAKPVNTAAPVLSGTPAVGSTLSCSTGSWEHSPTGYSFAWRRDGSLISGQTGSGYTVQSGDAGHGISCEVTASNGGGSASAASNTLSVVASPSEEVVAPPSEAKSTTSEPTSPPSPHGSTGVADAPSVATVAGGGTVLIPLTCSGSQSCHGTLELFALIAQKPNSKRSLRSRTGKGNHGVLIGKGRFSVSAGHRATVKVKLNRKGKALVHHAKASGLRVALTGTGIKKRTVKIKPRGSGSRHHHRKHR